MQEALQKYFYNVLRVSPLTHGVMEELKALYQTILTRKASPQEGSYTCYLFEKGLDKILKKVGEESSETIIAAKNGNSEEVVLEVGDLLFHLLVMLAELEIPLEAVEAELAKRSQKIGNLKVFKQTDKNT
jgi:phosphoribosyl-ATP pyrophosphohydrolase